MECYKIENKEDALLLACHLLRDHRVEGFVDENGTLIIEYKTYDGQWFFVYEKLVIQPRKVRKIEQLHPDPDTGEPVVETYRFGGPPEHRVLDSSLSVPGCGYWCNTQGPLFPVDWELKDILYPILPDSPSDKEFEIPEDWETKKHLLTFSGCYYPFMCSDWMENRRKEIRSWLSEEDFVKLAFLWSSETGQSHIIDSLRMFDNELLDNVLHKAACIPRVDEAKFKYLLRTAISEAAATYCADTVASKVARVIGY